MGSVITDGDSIDQVNDWTDDGKLNFDMPAANFDIDGFIGFALVHHDENPSYISNQLEI